MRKDNLKDTPHENFEEALFTGFKDIRAKNVPLGGEVVQQEALCFARLLGRDDFKASTGWLSIFTADFDRIAKLS